MRRRIALILLLSLAISLFSCSEDTDFSHAELNIPLPDSFSRVEKENYDAAFTDGILVVTVSRLSFAMCYEDGIPDTMNSREFARFWTNRSEIDADLQVYGGVDFVEYKTGIDGYEYYYVSAFYRTQYAYFIVVFATASYNEDSLRSDILGYMSSVYFIYDK